MNNVVLITHEQDDDDKTSGQIIVSIDNIVRVEFHYEDFKIVDEEPDSDCEDFNDNARWLAKTFLEILKLEYNDDMAHCDWSADVEQNPQTGKYKFSVSLEKVRE